MTDLFEAVETLSQEVQDILFKYGKIYDDTGFFYEDLNAFLLELKPLGYKFDYGLDSMPYNLRKI